MRVGYLQQMQGDSIAVASLAHTVNWFSPGAYPSSTVPNSGGTILPLKVVLSTQSRELKSRTEGSALLLFWRAMLQLSNSVLSDALRSQTQNLKLSKSYNSVVGFSSFDLQQQQSWNTLALGTIALNLGLHDFKLAFDVQEPSQTQLRQREEVPLFRVLKHMLLMSYTSLSTYSCSSAPNCMWIAALKAIPVILARLDAYSGETLRQLGEQRLVVSMLLQQLFKSSMSFAQVLMQLGLSLQRFFFSVLMVASNMTLTVLLSASVEALRPQSGELMSLMHWKAPISDLCLRSLSLPNKNWVQQGGKLVRLLTIKPIDILYFMRLMAMFLKLVGAKILQKALFSRQAEQQVPSLFTKSLSPRTKAINKSRTIEAFTFDIFQQLYFLYCLLIQGYNLAFWYQSHLTIQPIYPSLSFSQRCPNYHKPPSKAS